MKGLLFIVLIYLFTLFFCIAVKIVTVKIESKKKGAVKDTPKIYYVTPQKKVRKKVDDTIPIKATVVEKEERLKF